MIITTRILIYLMLLFFPDIMAKFTRFSINAIRFFCQYNKS